MVARRFGAGNGVERGLESATITLSEQSAGRSNAARLACVTAALVVLAISVAACGVGIGAGEDVGHVELRVSRDFGETTLVEVAAEPLTESDTVMRVLDRHAEIETLYGGGFVQSIDGLEGGTEGGRPYDWLFFVNGIESDRGGADYPLIDGDRIWWDYRDWGATMRVPAVVGQFPEPFINGFGGGPPPATAVECPSESDACEVVTDALAEAGANLDPAAEAPARVLVGTWAELARNREAAAIAQGPLRSGVYLRIEDGSELVALDPRGEDAARYRSGYGFIAATRLGEGPPIWIVSGVDQAGLAAAADSFNADDLAGRFALVAGPEGPIPLPVSAR